MKVSLHAAALAVSLGLGAVSVIAAPVAAARVAKSSAATVSGTIKSVDASAKTLTLTTAKGDETFTIGDKTSIHHGSKTATVADLSSLTGQPAKVHFTESNGTKMLTSVMVGGAHHMAAEHKAASSSTKPK
jgi:hypothetical protein